MASPSSSNWAQCFSTLESVHEANDIGCSFSQGL